MWTSGLEIGTIALPYRVDVKRVSARRELRSFQIDLHAGFGFRQYCGANFVAFGVVNIGVARLGHRCSRENWYSD